MKSIIRTQKKKNETKDGIEEEAFSITWLKDDTGAWLFELAKAEGTNTEQLILTGE